MNTQTTNSTSSDKSSTIAKKPALKPWNAVVGDIVVFTLLPMRSTFDEEWYEGRVEKRDAKTAIVKYKRNVKGASSEYTEEAIVPISHFRKVKIACGVRLGALTKKFTVHKDNKNKTNNVKQHRVNVVGSMKFEY